MKVSDFDYQLPSELIAQTPLAQRSNSRLLVLDKKTNTLSHDYFYNIKVYLKPHDVLVLNDTKVLPARLYGKKSDTQAKIELLILKEITKDVYSCLVKPAKRLKEGSKLNFSDKLSSIVIKKLADGICHVKFIYQGIFVELLQELGQMPLPPYIHEKLIDQDRYQTVYAKVNGSAAAPTAGLHFTQDLLQELKEMDIKIIYITLHVGLGTFRPVSVENVEEHIMHSEYYELNAETANILNDAKQKARRIISVGTTTTRVLEANLNKYQKFTATKEETAIFIYPGYHFQAIDGLITNFHLPRSSLLMLVSAFATRESILKAYEEAIACNYRFFSFGDAMFIK